MKTLIITLMLGTVFFSCSKKDSLTEAPLKAVGVATVNGKTITFDASKSTGNIVAYGYALTIYSPTTGGSSNPITFSPSGGNYEGSNFIPITATVTKTGVYVFSLIVYNKLPITNPEPTTNYDMVLITVEVK